MKTTHDSKLTWNGENIKYLIKWWPHFGSRILSNELNIPFNKIIYKANKLKLKMHPKSIRMCKICKINIRAACAARTS